MRVLVVDDDAVFRVELGDLLEEDGHTVASAPNVAKALEELEGQEFDLVLTDLKMPRRSGLELLREVRARWPRTLVIMITGYATVESALEAMKEGAFDYVRKPFRADQLRAALALAAQQRAFESPETTLRDPVREARSLIENGDHEVLLLGETEPRPAAHLHFERLSTLAPVDLVTRVESFVAEYPHAAVVIAGVEELVERHRLEDVVSTLDRLRSITRGHGPLRVGFDPSRLSGPAAVAVGTAVAGESTHELFEALGSPIRRKVLERLSTGPATFGAVMSAAGLDDSPKMSFHLRKLVEAKLIAHVDDLYRLTARGVAGHDLLVVATFLPPAAATDDLAFPGPSTPETDPGSSERRRRPGP